MPNVLDDLDLESWLDEPATIDPSKYAHMVRRVPPMNAEITIMMAVMAGEEVVGLCGYKWRPKGIAPDSLPACPKCIAEWERLSQ